MLLKTYTTEAFMNNTVKLCGNAVVGQSGGPTAAINATLAGVILGAKEYNECGIIKRFTVCETELKDFFARIW
jgi:hypothetical protein